MTDEQANWWSWATTLLCAAYVAWICFQIATRVPLVAGMFAGLGGEIPLVTRFVLMIAQWPIYVIGLILIAGLILKEKWETKIVVRFAITMIIFMTVSWFAGFVIDAMYQPLFEIMDKING